jgi:hypothetical protein
MTEKCQHATSNEQVAQEKSHPKAALKFNPVIEDQAALKAASISFDRPHRSARASVRCLISLPF